MRQDSNTRLEKHARRQSRACRKIFTQSKGTSGGGYSPAPVRSTKASDRHQRKRKIVTRKRVQRDPGGKEKRQIELCRGEGIHLSSVVQNRRMRERAEGGIARETKRSRWSGATENIEGARWRATHCPPSRKKEQKKAGTVYVGLITVYQATHRAKPNDKRKTTK